MTQPRRSRPAGGHLGHPDRRPRLPGVGLGRGAGRGQHRPRREDQGGVQGQPGPRLPGQGDRVHPGQRMTWSGGMPLGLFKGVRTFTLAPGVKGRGEQWARRSQETRRAPVRGGPSSGKPYLVAWRSRTRLTMRNRVPPATRAIPAISIGPAVAPVKGSSPPPVVLVAAPTAASVVVGARVVDGATSSSGAVVVVGSSSGSVVVVGSSVVVVVVDPESSHFSAGGSSSLPLLCDVSPLSQWATARKVIVPVVPAGRSKCPENWLCLGPKKWSSDSSSVTSPLSL